MLCVPAQRPGLDTRARRSSGVPEQLRDEIAHFFEVYKDLEPDKHVEVGGWRERDVALDVYQAGRERWAAANRVTP